MGRPLLSDPYGATKQVNVTDAQPCHLPPAKSEQGADPDDGRLTNANGVCEIDDVIGGQLGSRRELDRWKLDPSTRRPDQPVGFDGVAKHRSEHGVVPSD